MGDYVVANGLLLADIPELVQNVEIVNSVVMTHVISKYGCLIQGSVVCTNVHLQGRVKIKYCLK